MSEKSTNDNVKLSLNLFNLSQKLDYLEKQKEKRKNLQKVLDALNEEKVKKLPVLGRPCASYSGGNLLVYDDEHFIENIRIKKIFINLLCIFSFIFLFLFPLPLFIKIILCVISGVICFFSFNDILEHRNKKIFSVLFCVFSVIYPFTELFALPLYIRIILLALFDVVCFLSFKNIKKFFIALFCVFNVVYLFRFFYMPLPLLILSVLALGGCLSFSYIYITSESNTKKRENDYIKKHSIQRENAHNKDMENYYSEILPINNKISELEKQIPELDENIKSKTLEIYSDNTLPLEYKNRDAAFAIWSYISGKRADTLKEAINLYEFEKAQKEHYVRMEAHAEQTTLYAKEQAEATLQQAIWAERAAKDVAAARRAAESQAASAAKAASSQAKAAESAKKAAENAEKAAKDIKRIADSQK